MRHMIFDVISCLWLATVGNTLQRHQAGEFSIDG